MFDEAPSNDHPALDDPPPNPAYRLYKLAGSHIAGPADVIVCADDHEAIKIAKQHLDGAAIEIWHGPRLVTRIEPH
jgi:hypothetical protein